jgi:SAM-dependent methyltransferase
MRRRDIFEHKPVPPSYRARVDSRELELGWFEDEGSLPSELYLGKTVLDWECGDCAYSAALLNHGASDVVSIDSKYDKRRIPNEVWATGLVKLTKLDIQSFVNDRQNFGKFDLIFCNTVTEHVQDLPMSFSALYNCLKSGGYLFTNHGNYYDPVGSHDHGFMFYQNGGVEFLGPRCWESAEKCNASEAFRAGIARKVKWTMSDDFDAHLTPDNCNACPYFKRSQPWAHLLYQSEFRSLYDRPEFTTGRKRSSLNKVTAFQVRQLLIEAGFDITKENRSMVTNDPPQVLLCEPFNFSTTELKTGTHRYLARKPIDGPEIIEEEPSPEPKLPSTWKRLLFKALGRAHIPYPLKT